MYVFILQQENNTHIMPEGQHGPEALTAARNKKCLDQILTTTWQIKIHSFIHSTYNTTETKHNKNPSLINSGPERTT